MSKIYEVVAKFKIEVEVYDEDTPISTIMDELEYDFQTGMGLNADIQYTELLDYEVHKETYVESTADTTMSYIHRMENYIE